MYEKYPECYFEHWLEMFDSNNLDWTEENFKNMIEFYKKVEGEDEYNKLQNEIREIIKNNDLINFNLIAKGQNESELTLDDLHRMTSIILIFK